VIATIAIAIASTALAGQALPARSADRDVAVRAIRADLDAGTAALEAGDLRAAEPAFRAALEQARRAAGADLLVARAADGLADVHRESGRHAEAEPLYVEAAALWERALGADQPRLATTLHNLGVTRLHAGRAEDAGGPLRRALGIWERTLGPGSPEAAATRAALARLATDAR
jgi:Tfp pilus assembly protein PilF